MADILQENDIRVETSYFCLFLVKWYYIEETEIISPSII